MKIKSTITAEIRTGHSMQNADTSYAARAHCTRYTAQQMHRLLDHVEIEERVLDACGNTEDALVLILAEGGCQVTTNDINHM